MFELLEWWNKKSRDVSPVISSAILHYQFEHIHPFADGNGRTGRALIHMVLKRRGLLIAFLAMDNARAQTPYVPLRKNPFRDIRVRRAVGAATP